MIAFFIGLVGLRILCCAFFVLLAIRLAAAIRARHGDSALRILETRFVNGEIPEDELARRKAILEDN